MDFDELWDAERRFWLDGPDFYDENMAADALMVFPPPVGILRGEAIIAGLRQGPRWSSIEMTETAQTALADTVVLAYRARGQRDGAAPYIASCSSTYVRDGGGWKLLAHQQTPVG
jgi:hypothetical protein